MLSIFVAAFARTGHATDAPLSINQYRHTMWKASQGAPSPVLHMAQSADGVLWLGTSDGLSRFDGVKFETISPAASDPTEPFGVSPVLPTRSGELWVGIPGGRGVAVFRDGRFVSTGMPDPGVEITDLKQDRDGAIWAVNAREENPLRRYRQGRWEIITPAMGMPDGWVTSLICAQDGTVWVATMDKLVILRRGATRFTPTNAHVAPGAGLAEDRHGRIWISDHDGTRRLPDYPRGATNSVGEPSYPPVGEIRRAKITFAPDGALWGVTRNLGVFRIQSPEKDGAVSRFLAVDGLTDDGALIPFVDREGTVWIGADTGLNAFVSTGLMTEQAVPRASQSIYVIERDDLGSVYMATGRELFVARDGRPPRRVWTGPEDILAVCRGGLNGLWVVGKTKAVHFVDGRRDRTMAVGDSAQTNGCGQDPKGSLWLAGDDGALTMFDGVAWQDKRNLIPPGVGRPADLTFDPQGRLIVNLEYHDVARIDGQRVETWSGKRLGLGRLTMVQQSPLGLLVGGSAGLARIGDNGIARLETGRHPWVRNVHSVTQSQNGETWVLSRSGLVRLAPGALERAFRHPDQDIPHRLLDDQDGFAERPQSNVVGLQTAQGADGRLWILTRRAVLRVDPAVLTSNPLPPPVVVRAIIADGRTFKAENPVVLPKGSSNITIAYTALSLRTPGKVRFRYQLEGIDRTWIDPGLRREAIYTSLPPGHHRFKVIAANDAGVWNNTGATIDFTVPKTFIQSNLFIALCALAIAGLIWFIFSLRVQVVAGSIRSRMTARLAERERIARELHDTLLQGVQGLILRFQLVAEELPQSQPVRASLEETLDRADDLLAEARDRVRNLRISDADGDFESALNRLLQAQNVSANVTLKTETEGRPRDLDLTVCHEVLQIVSEALFNALRHAKATTIVVRTVYRPWAFSVAVVDDGVGIAGDVLREGRAGHFGLTGMRERARRIEARLQIVNKSGVRVTLVVPGAIAYASGLLKRLLNWRRRPHA